MRQRSPASPGSAGLAALLVVLIHTSGVTEFDWLGLPTYGPVSLFVISGFLLYRPWARWSLGQARRPDLGQFVLRAPPGSSPPTGSC